MSDHQAGTRAVPAGHKALALAAIHTYPASWNVSTTPVGVPSEFGEIEASSVGAGPLASAGVALAASLARYRKLKSLE